MGLVVSLGGLVIEYPWPQTKQAFNPFSVWVNTNALLCNTLSLIVCCFVLRPHQRAELVRLSQTLLLVPALHWILVEDSAERTAAVAELLAHTDLPYTHLNVQTPPAMKMKDSDPNWLKPRGVEQRNEALRWLREHKASRERGVVYFADDDNTYSVKIFQEVRNVTEIDVEPP